MESQRESGTAAKLACSLPSKHFETKKNRTPPPSKAAFSRPYLGSGGKASLLCKQTASGGEGRGVGGGGKLSGFHICYLGEGF